MQRIHFSAKGLTVDKTSNQAFFFCQSKAETVNKYPVQIYCMTAEAAFLHLTTADHIFSKRFFFYQRRSLC